MMLKADPSDGDPHRRPEADVRGQTEDAETVTVGGSPPGEVLRMVDADDRAAMASDTEPNGWFAGPHGDPDRFQLLGRGLAGGEGNIWRARYRGELTSPLT